MASLQDDMVVLELTKDVSGRESDSSDNNNIAIECSNDNKDPELFNTIDGDLLNRGGGCAGAVKEAPEPEEEKTSEKAKEFFKKIAGEDMEVDWLELKDILDYAMRKELPRASSQSQDSIVTTLLALVCGVVCRDTPLGQAFEVKNDGFSKDVCRSMIAMMDVDRSGKLGFEEFKALWVDIRHWKDGSGYLSAFELRHALNSAGYRLNNNILNILAHRYSSKDGMITFDDFMMCAVRLKGLIGQWFACFI
uniref:EF-hand domain-containing protein n=1 Tax=Timema shepardi TaxID=629360 RepID=A0A7R9B3D7_TIMSH|nr:unnamed protein product [Timema shepardi]